MARRPSRPRSASGWTPNWWAPNITAIRGMLQASGFAHVEVVWRRSLPIRATRWIRSKGRLSRGRALSRDRVAFHARVE